MYINRTSDFGTYSLKISASERKRNVAAELPPFGVNFGVCLGFRQGKI